MDNNNGQQYGQGYPQPDMPQTDMSQQYGQYDQQAAQGYPQPDVSQQYGQYDQQAAQGYPQPDMSQQYGQYDQYSQYGQPVAAGGNGGDGGNPKKPKKSLGTGAIIGIIAGGLALVAVIVCAIIFIPKSDKEVVLDAFANTFATSASDNYAEETFGSEELQKNMEEKGASQSYAISIDSVGPALDEEYTGLGLSVDFDKNNADKKASGVYNITYNGSELLNVGFYTDNENIYTSVSDLFDGYLTLPCKDGLTALAKSYIWSALDMDDAILSGDITIFPENDASESSDVSTVNADAVNIIEKLWDETEFEKVGKTKIDVNGETVSAKEYTVTISEENLETAITDIVDMVKNNPEALEESGVSSDDVETYVEQIKQLVPTIISEDFVLSVYIADDKIVKLSSDASANIMGIKIGYDFYLDINDNLSGALEFSAAGQTAGISCDIKNFSSSPNGDIKLSVSGEDEVVVAIESDNSTSDSAKTVKGSVTVSYEDERVCKLSVDWNSDRANQTFGGTFGIYGSNDEGDAIDVAIDGKFTDIKKGEGYSIEINKIQVSMEKAELLTLSVKSSVDTNPAVEDIDTSLPCHDITTMTEDDFASLIDTSSDAYLSWIERISESGILDLFNMGSSTSTAYISEDSDDDDVDYEELLEDNDEEMTNILESYDESVKVEILGTIEDYKQTYGSVYSVEFEDDNNDVSISYRLDSADSPDVLLGEYSYYDESAILEQEYNKSITLSDGSEIGYDMMKTDFLGDTCGRYYFVRDLGNGYMLTADVVDYSDSITAEAAAETLAEKYFKVQ